MQISLYDYLEVPMWQYRNKVSFLLLEDERIRTRTNYNRTLEMDPKVPDTELSE
jgi:hypothetical protein